MVIDFRLFSIKNAFVFKGQIMEISILCGRMLLSKDEALWHTKEEFVIDSVWKHYYASSLPCSLEKHKHFLFSGTRQLVALIQFSYNHSLTLFRVSLSIGTKFLGMLNLFYSLYLV